jgi:hypothetical protein
MLGLQGGVVHCAPSTSRKSPARSVFFWTAVLVGGGGKKHYHYDAQHWGTTLVGQMCDALWAPACTEQGLRAYLLRVTLG